MPWRRDPFLLLQAFLAAILMAPLWCAAMPAMPDYPAHLAGFFLIGGGAHDSLLSHFYRIDWALLPNLASELTVPLLAKILPLGVAARLFLSAAIGLWVLGPAFLQRALFGRAGVSALFAAFFAYNANFMWGFFNYTFAAGLMLAVFAAWVASEERRGPWRLAGFALAVGVLYISHIFAAATLLLLVGAYELSGLWAERTANVRAVARRALPVVLVFLPTAAAFLLLHPPGMHGSDIQFNILDTLDDRLSAAMMFDYDKVAYLVLAVFGLIWLAGFLTGRFAVHPRMIVPLIVLGLATLLAPEWAMGGWGVDLRLPALLGALLFAAGETRTGPRLRQGLAAALVLLAVWNAAKLAGNWVYYDHRFREFRAGLDALPRGEKLVTVLDGNAIGLASDQIYWHIAEYGIIDRAAFTALMFATPGQHVVQLQPRYRTIAALSAEEGSPPDVSELEDLAAGEASGDPDIQQVFPYLLYFQCHFDVAVVIHGGGAQSPVPDFLTLRHRGSFFSLYDIHPTPVCAKR